MVDDASPDGTQAVAEALAREYGCETVVLRPRAGKLGLGASPSASRCRCAERGAQAARTYTACRLRAVTEW